MKINHNILQKIDFKQPYAWLATWFGCGLMKPGPGTWGTIGGLPFGMILLVVGGWPVLLAASCLFFVIGYRASKKFEEVTGEHDAGAIVIDEVVGIWIALIPATFNPLSILLAFVLFRFFDILKPWPISWCDKEIPGAWGVMIDDVVAGIFAAFVLVGVRYAGLG